MLFRAYFGEKKVFPAAVSTNCAKIVPAAEGRLRGVASGREGRGMNKIDHNKIMFEQMQAAPRGAKLLLHSCCGPCSTRCLEALREYFTVTVVYYNPNITDAAEYEKRKAEQIRFLRETGWAEFLDCDYDPACFYAAAKGLEKEPEGGARCGRCFSLRLSCTARLAAEKGFPYYCSTLSVSPHKNAALLNELGEKYAAQYGVIWLHNDFKKQNGYLRSIELSKEHRLYRQNYCGCEFSLRAGEKGALPAESRPKQE